MAQAARYHADRTAIVHGAVRLTFAEAWTRGVRLANALIALGLKPGDRIASLEDNSLAAADLIQACAIANLVRVPLYARNALDAHTHMITNTGCRAVVVAADYAEDIVAIRDRLDRVEHVLVRDDGYEAWLATHPATEPEVAISPDDYFVIRHTGGTTGNPKAVAYSNRSWLAACRDWFYIFPQVVPGDACLHIGPISHASGYQYLPVWLAGGCNVLANRFEPAETIDLIERERIAFCQVVATMLRALIDHPGSAERDFSSLKCMLVGASPVEEHTALEAHALFGDVLFQGYGATEVLPVAFMGPQQWFADVPGSNPLRACGTIMPFALIDIRDEDGVSLAVGESGEIYAKADGQMTGFWNNPEASEERIVDGWVRTGDIGRIDGNGYVYLIDRAADLIISGGYNIWPLDLERVISAIPGVSEVAVFGVPHPRWGEAPMAQCVLAPGAALDEAAIIARVAAELGRYMKPAAVAFQSDPLPRSAVGKLNRKALREPHWANVERRIQGS
jgi:acyl-CoA synthetase (AMP-forming)/AMP-acid ligase II